MLCYPTKWIPPKCWGDKSLKLYGCRRSRPHEVTIKHNNLVYRISAVFYHLEIWPPNVSCTNPHFMTPLLYRVKVIKQGLVKRSQRWRQLKHWKLPKNTVLPPICQSRGSLTLSFNWFSKIKKIKYDSLRNKLPDQWRPYCTRYITM